MPLFKIIPIIGISWGVLFLFFLIASKNVHTNNMKARIILIAILLLNIHLLVDSYLTLNDLSETILSVLSYLNTHLVGFLVLLYTNSLLKIKNISKKVILLMVVYTLARYAFVILLSQKVNTIEGLIQNIKLIYIDYSITYLANIIPLIWLYLQLQPMKFAVRVKEYEKKEFLWIKYLVLSFIITYLVVGIIGIFELLIDEEAFLLSRFDSLIITLLFFIFSFLSIRVPVFAVHGDYNEIKDSDEEKKYANSSLNESKQDELWSKIQNIMQKDKPYREPDFRLNKLAELCGESLHHVSQVINAREGKSFFDFINTYRINEAKELLISPQGEQFTILAIAYEVGFNSKNPFYNAFKKETGMTPSEFKRQN
jgi:AraC-like DNA-binding protein